jgi:hypothetical protein
MVQRWWDDADTAHSVLNRVDDRDVTQGVGTAVLAYHALAKHHVAPLAKQTLVDVSTALDALDAVDREPVAKALAASLEPVMGVASEEYGRLLAEQIHADASSGVEHALKVWQANGVPMPLAVERAAEVVGVPHARLGQYVSKVKGATVPPGVLADYADRALMEFASHVGRRENTSDVFKSAGFRVADHPRDDDGRFAPKAKETSVDLDDRLARLKRLQRMESVTSLRSEDRVEAKTSMSFADAVAALKPSSRLRDVRQTVDRRVVERRTVEREREVASEPASVVDKPSSAPLREIAKPPARSSRAKTQWDQSYVERDMSDHMMFVPERVAAKLLGGWNASTLRNLLKKEAVVVFMPRDNAGAPDSGLYHLLVNTPNMVAINIAGDTPIHDGTPDDDRVGVVPPKEANFGLVPQDKGRELFVAYSEGGSQAHSVSVPVLRFTWDGERPDSKDWLKKSDERWRVRGEVVTRHVERDVDGKFTDVDNRLARLKRLERIQNVVAKPPAQEVKPALSFADAVAALKPERTVTDRHVGERTISNRKVSERKVVDRVVAPAESKAVSSPRITPVSDVVEEKHLKYGTAQAIRMTDAHLQELFDDAASLDISGKSDDSIFQFWASKDARTMLRGLHKTSFKDAFEEYANEGVESSTVAEFNFDPDDPASYVAASQRARSHQEQWENHTGGNGRGGGPSHSYGLTVGFNTITLNQVEYPSEPDVFLTGDPKAMAALERGDDVILRIVQGKPAPDTLADLFGMPASAWRGLDVPASFVIVELPY